MPSSFNASAKVIYEQGVGWGGADFATTLI